MGYEVNLCSPHYISQLSPKNVSRVSNETEAVTQQRERKEEREIYLRRCLFRERRKQPEAGGPTQPHAPQPLHALILSLVAAGPPVLTFEAGRQPPLPTAGDWGAGVFLLIIWRGVSLPAVWRGEDWLLQHVRKPAAAQRLAGRVQLLTGPT